MDKALVPEFTQDYIATSFTSRSNQWWKEASIEPVLETEERATVGNLELYNEAMDYSWECRK